MDHSDDDKRFCVYVHRDWSGEIVYVGSGNSKRPFALVNRSKDHRDVWHSLTKEIVEDGLSKSDSLLKEQELLDFIGKLMRFLTRNTPLLGTPAALVECRGINSCLNGMQYGLRTRNRSLNVLILLNYFQTCPLNTPSITMNNLTPTPPSHKKSMLITVNLLQSYPTTSS